MNNRKERRETDGTFAQGNPGRPAGAKNKATLMREDTVRAIMSEKEPKDAEAEAAGIEGGWLATLDNKQFLELYKAIIPRNVEVAGNGYGTVLAALKAKAAESGRPPTRSAARTPRRTGS